MWGRDRLEAMRGRLRAVRDRLALGDRLQTIAERFPRAAAIAAALWGRMRDEPLLGVALSVALHVLIIGLIVYLGGPGSTYNVKRGEPLFVELPEIKDQSPRVNPAARETGSPAPPAPAVRPPAAVQAPPTPPAPRAQPPAPKVAAPNP